MEYCNDHTLCLGVRAIVINHDYLLAEKGKANPVSKDARTCYGFIGGHYEPDDTFEYRLRKEFEKKTNARVVSCAYAFVLENRHIVHGVLRQGVDHYFRVTIDREDISTKEPHITHHWLPVKKLNEFDLRTKIVRDLIATGEWTNTHRVVVPLPSE